MFKKIVIGILAMTVVGAGGAAIGYQMSQQPGDVMVSTPLPDTQVGRMATIHQGDSKAVEPGEPMAADQQGEQWSVKGVIEELDDFGFTLAQVDGGQVYVELGPPEFWQAQDVTLAEGQTVVVDGSVQDDMLHAANVTLEDGQVLSMRTETGQPLWSGGAENGRQGENGQGVGDGDHVPDPQAQVDAWVTMEGQIVAYQRGQITIETEQGQLTFQSGQPRFFEAQGVTLQIGDPIQVLGFWENEQFMAGEILQLETGARVMLRDPNGRPLWAGPGNGGSGGNGNGNGGGQGQNQG